MNPAYSCSSRSSAAAPDRATPPKRLAAPFITLATLLGSSLLPSAGFAQVPHDMTYQGRLTDAFDVPVVGPVALVLRVYDLPAGGDPLYTETHPSVMIDSDDGTFVVRLGLGLTDLDTDGDGEIESNAFPFDATLFLNGPNRYLEVQVGSGSTGEVLFPRQPLGGSPYALVAEDVVADPSSNVGALIDGAQQAAQAAQQAADDADSNHTIDTTLNEAQVDSFVANNGFLTSEDLADSLTPEQPVPSMTSHHNSFVATITDPAPTSFGYGATFPNHDLFPAVPGNESDNQLGAFYNKDGVNGGPLNQFEHAMDSSWELSWRASGTGNHTWLEHNIDFWPPTNRTTVTNVAGFNPAPGDDIQFSGGGTGVVVSWIPANNSLTWRQDYAGVDPSASELITHPATGTANMGASILALGSSDLWRTRQLEWDVYTNKSVWKWRTQPADGTPDPFRLGNDGAGVGFDGNIGGGISLTVGSHTSNQPTTRMIFQSRLLSDQPLVESRVLDLQYDFGGTGNTYHSLSGIRFLSPTATGAGSTNNTGRRHHIEVFDQRGHGSTSSALYVAAQTCPGACTGGPSNHGNITVRGGDWNNGHYAFGEETNSGDHFWRDQSNEVYRASTDDAPDSATDGVPFVTGTGATTHGPALWAISNGSTHGSPAAVCGRPGVGMTAQSGWNLVSGTMITAGDLVPIGQAFIAFCR
jgi:hypothetical protein